MRYARRFAIRWLHVLKLKFTSEKQLPQIILPLCGQAVALSVALSFEFVVFLATGLASCLSIPEINFTIICRVPTSLAT